MRVAAVCCLLLVGGSVSVLAGLETASAQPTTQPAPMQAAPVQSAAVTPPAPPGPPAPGSIEYRVMQSLAVGDYATALPLLRRMEEMFKDDPRKSKAIAEQIRAAERALNSGYAAGTLPPEERKPLPPPADGQVTEFANIKELGNFEYDPEVGGSIPADVKAMSEHLVRVRGFMIPMDQAENITTFALVPDLFACCFGQPPQIQHTIVVRTPKGKAVGYYPDEIVVEGTLKVEEKKEDGFVISVFELTARSVKPVAQ